MNPVTTPARWDFFGTDGGRGGWQSYAIMWVRVVFGAHSLLSGVNYFYPLVPPPPIDMSPAGAFVGQMDAVGLYALIKVVEVAVGIMLLLNRWVPLALVAELPTTVSIFYLSVIVDGRPRQLYYTGPRELLFNAGLMLAYWPYFRALLAHKASVSPIWRKGLTIDGIDPVNGGSEGKILP